MTPQTLTHAQWEEVKGRFDRWVGEYSPCHLSDGRVGVDFGDNYIHTLEDMVGCDIAGCVVESYMMDDGEPAWAITYPPEPPSDMVEAEFPF